YSTYFGGLNEDRGYAITVNRAGNAFVTGVTSGGADATSGAAQTTSGGGSDAFATEFSTTGRSLVYSTYIGGTRGDEGRGIAVGLDGEVTVVGKAGSGFPTFSALYGTNAGGTDAFVTKLTPLGGRSWTYSTYLGGSLDDQANGVAVDLAGDVYVTG